MNKEHKRRPPVFQASEEPTIKSEEPVIHSEELEDFLGGDSEDSLLEEEQEDSLEEIQEEVSPEEAPITEPTLNEEILPNAWKVLGDDQKSGKTYLVTHDVQEPGVQAFWRKTRVLSHARWITHGKWTDPLTRAEILPEPRLYKDVG